MSSAGGDPRALLSSRWFRVRHSAWVLPAIFGFGFLTWISFLYVGARARRWPWLLAGLGYVAATTVVVTLIPAPGAPDRAMSDWTAGAILALWGGGIVHAMLVNRSWLRWRAEHRTPWYADRPLAPPPVPPPAPPRYPLPPELAVVDVDPGRYWAPGRPVDIGPADVGPVDAGPADAGALDLNTAQAHELATLPGMTVDRVRRALHERQARRGFATVAEFADATGLAPHEHYRVRGLVTCAPHPRPTPPPGRGRVLDY